MAGHSRISHVGFGVSGDEEHVRDSFANINNHELFSASGQPIAGGVYDLRLGTTDHGFQCTTCANGKKQCPGHRGHLSLRAGVLQPIGVAEVRRWLRIVCFKCGAVLVDRKKFAHLPPAKRLAEAAAADVAGRRCARDGCGAVHPRIVKEDEDYFTFWAEDVGAGAGAGAARGTAAPRTKLYPDAIKAILSRVSDSDIAALGRAEGCHPSRLVLREIAVPPTTTRPSVKSFGGASSYHDTTNLIQNIAKRNAQLPTQLPDAMGPLGPGGDVPGELDRALQNLQQIYYNLVMGSSSTSATQGSSGRRGLIVGARPVRSILSGMARKSGRIRANLLGKRVFYISRSTISGNTQFRVDEVGLPQAFARTLQVMEHVQEYNREWLMPFFLNGRRQYPGCTLVVRRATGEVHDVSRLRDLGLEVGDVLYRDVVDGDYAFFNRQPTLERSSIGVHRIVVIRDPAVHTIQMNVLACEWYNADFDGDQMNLWVARNPGARIEAMIMSRVSNWFISTKTSGPVNGEVQDSIVGCYEMTRGAVRLDKYHAMALFASAGVDPPRFDGEPAGHLYTGRDMVTLLLAHTPVTLQRVPASFSEVYAPFIGYDPSDTLTVIKRGRLEKGVLDKRSVGAKASGGLFHLISREYGPQRALDLIFALQQLSLQFLLYSGFTVGTADLLPTAEATEQIRALVSSIELESRVVTERLLRGEIVPPIDSTVRAFYEKLQINALRVPESEIMRWVLKSIRPETNGFFRMIAVGSKGNNPNLIHVCGAIGQTTINGERLRGQFAFGRTTPYSTRFSTAPLDYGFVRNSYMTGMGAGEFLAQGMNGRFDLITKALSTAGTGYFMRKGVMNNQSDIVDNLLRVCKNTKVVQMLYGEDGLDARELEKIEFRTTPMDDARLAGFAGVDVRAAGAAGSAAELAAAQAAADAALAAVRADRDEYRRVLFRAESSNFGSGVSADRLMPVNIRRLVENVVLAARDADAPPLTAAGLGARIGAVREFCERLPYALLNEIQERRRAPVPPHKAAALKLMCMQVRAELNPQVLAAISDEQLAYITDAVRHRFSLSVIDYGTAVGILAAQATSEPLTQYMLDSHHRSVAGGTSKSGLVRVNEIYGACSVADEQTSSMLLPLRPAPGDPAARAAEIANSIEYMTLRQFVSQYDVLLEPCDALRYPPYAADAAWIAEYGRTHPLVRAPGDLTNWCVRCVLDKSALVLKSVELELIVRRLRASNSGFYVVHTSEAVPEIVIRLWCRASLFKRGDQASVAAGLVEAALDAPVRGIPGVVRATAEKITRARAGAGGALVQEERYAVATAGTNLYSAALHGAVDASLAISSSVGDTYDLLGIEAARAKIISETVAFMADNAPNPRHLCLYADEMTRTGRVTSIERGGLGAREHSNVLLRMAYGAPVQVVTDAALAGAQSQVYGIAAPQLLGATPQIGTLYNSLAVDDEFVRGNLNSVDSFLDGL